MHTNLLGELLPGQVGSGAQFFDAVSYPLFF
jgi:hypothetical protein